MNDKISREEIVELAAVDDELYCRTFFPATYRQPFPSYHETVTAALENPAHRYVALKMFRGSAKTTRLRTFVSKRIAYGISNTILFVSNAQKHSFYSVRWIRRQVEFNTLWAQTFNLRPGPLWNDDILQILHGVDDYLITVLPLGITGQIRGINLDDYRPDLIVLDDPDNEETTRTPEQREKTSDLIFGALQKSLAPPTENPMAKMVGLQTPLNEFDFISTVSKSPQWHIVEVSCFNKDNESVWPERLPTAFLREEKREHIRLNKLSLWMREMEVRIVAKETAAFDVTWLRYWDETGLPPGMRKRIAIDPASSDNKNADDQVIGVVGFRGRDVYLVEYTAETGEMPDAAANTFLSYLSKHTILTAAVESISYQRILAWYIEKAMRAARKFVLVRQVQDKRRKSDRIIQALREKAAHGHLFVHSSHTKFIQQFADYRPGVEMHDDVLDMLAIAITDDKGYQDETVLEGEYRIEDESHIPAFELEYGAP
jgi:hypothetical protein